jgi:hypothetical protein
MPSRPRLPRPCLLLFVLVPLAALAGCSGPADAPPSSASEPAAAPATEPARDPAARELDGDAQAYVGLVLAAGRHDRQIVDAYYGPREWLDAAAAGEPVPIPELLSRTRELAAKLRSAPPSARREFLLAELVALETVLEGLAGERLPLADEARLLFDLEPAYTTTGRLDAALAELERAVPGGGDLRARVEALRARFVLPPDRVDAVARAVLAETRKRTTAHVKLPAGEGVALRKVTGKPWGAYNWYLGSYKSRIEVSTDLPLELEPFARTLAHEGYPGHHAFNVLLEEHLVRGRGWAEFTVYPLWSPQSLVAEGTANAGWDVIFPEDGGRAFLRDVVAPLAGFTDPAALDAYLDMGAALRRLEGVRPLAARMVLDEGRPEDEVRAFLMRYGVLSRERAQKAIDFARTYRSYVFTYELGEDLVEAYLGTGPDRAARFFGLLQRPVTPREIRRLR